MLVEERLQGASGCGAHDHYIKGARRYPERENAILLESDVMRGIN